ncbi:hypothetical protein EMCRGX_G026835 [Ephydatia muelleri]
MKRSRAVVEKKEENCERRFFWSCYKDSGFPHRVNHAVAAYSDACGNSYMYSVGGYHADDDQRTVLQADSIGGPFFRRSPIDIHCMDIGTRVWMKEEPCARKERSIAPYGETAIPGCRYGHTVCAYGGNLYMYGGRNDEDGSFSSMECYDIEHKVWLKLHCDGESPSSRDGHACTVIGKDMFIHGGFAANEMKFNGDTYKFDMMSHIWTKLPCQGEPVTERDFHTATAVNNLIFVFGGRSDMFAPFFTANDVYDTKFYTYNLDQCQWSKVEVTGYRPDGRRSHCAVHYGNSIIYFGGYNALSKQHFGDLFILNTESLHITKLQPFGDAPCPRRRVGCALIGSEFIICGGTSPIEHMRDGKKQQILHDHNDMYILHLVPSLEQLCTITILKSRTDIKALPLFLQERVTTVARLSQERDPCVG